jgi:hypothetical protein
MMVAALLLTVWLPVVAFAGINDYNNASLYPAPVRAMQFTNLMDSTHVVIWENWMVGFAKDLPTATWEHTDDGYNVVRIRQLLCVNKNDNDAHFCEFDIQFFDREGRVDCSVWDDKSNLADLYEVNCPDSIEFSN